MILIYFQVQGSEIIELQFSLFSFLVALCHSWSIVDGDLGEILFNILILIWGPYLMVIRDYSWFCSKGSVLVEFRGTICGAWN